MIRFIKFLIALLITGGLVYVLNNPIKTSSKTIPAIGPLINPFSGFWQNAEAKGTLPIAEISSTHLKGEVTVQYDDRLVPHIFADDISDALYAQGYITASHRLFQMDISTRAASGRVSEVVGERALKNDMLKRRKGMLFAAENAVEAWKDNEDYPLLLSYCQGVNDYIRSLDVKDYPLEYKILGFEPEEWTPLKTALFVKSMAESLAGRHSDVEATNSLVHFGEEKFNFLYPTYFEEQSPIIPESVKWNFPVTQIEDDTTDNDVISTFNYEYYNRPHAGNGSNNWAVAGSKTKSGNPILCGDPHLGLSLPSIWYEMQIKTPEMNAYGVTLPGVPFVIIGFNDHIAWTQTNVGHDISELYNIKWKDESKMEYLLDGEYKKVDLKIEEYQVKGKGLVKDTVRYTVWGPLRYESDTEMDKDLAYQWLAHQASTKSEITTFYELNKAKNYDEYYQALQTYNVPAQNYAFASKEGDVAIRVTGQFPLLEENQGRFVRDGSKSSSGWKGFIPKDHIPIVKNPSRGYISSANQHSTAPNYPYRYHREKFEAFRGRTANLFLDTMNNITIDDMKALQNSNYDLKAAEALPLMLMHLDSAIIKENSDIIKMMESWNCYADADSKATTLFNAWFSQIHNLIWDEINNSELPLLPASTIRTIHLMRDTPESEFFDITKTPETENIKSIVSSAFKNAMDKFEGEIPAWKDYQKPSIISLIRQPAFSRLNLNTGGVESALNSIKPAHGPSWRQIIELGDEMKAYVAYPGGQSGNPGSVYYDNFVDTWTAGKYYEAVFMKSPQDAERFIISTQVFKKK